MSNLYNCLLELCRANKVAPTRMCVEAGIPRNTMTELKSKRTKSISTDALAKVSAYFHVSADDLVQGKITAQDSTEIRCIDEKNPTQPDVPEGWEYLDDIDRKMVTDFIDRLLQADKYRRGEKEGGC